MRRIRPVVDANGQAQLAPITSIERYRRTLLFQQLGDTPAQIRALGGGATQFSMSTGDGGACGAPGGRGDLRGRRVARAAESHGEPGPALRDAEQHPRLARFCAAPGVRLGAGRQRARSARRPCCAPVSAFSTTASHWPTRWPRSATTGWCSSNTWSPIPDFFPNVPSPATLAGFQSTQVIQEVSAQSARAVHSAIGGHGGAAVAGQHHAGGDLYQFARAAPAALGRHQRAAARHLQSGCGRTAACFRWGIPGRWI